jgi:predicted nucleic acid-binding protein
MEGPMKEPAAGVAFSIAPGGDDCIKAHYLDASAMVMLLVDEADCDCAPVRRLFDAEPEFCSTPLCLAEALGVLKKKWDQKRLTDDEYFRAAQQLIVHAWSGKVRVDDLALFDPAVFAQVEKKGRAHGLDVSDALQLETIKKGYFSRAFVGGSAAVLITGDDELARAAAAEGIRVWDCKREPRPSWL